MRISVKEGRKNVVAWWERLAALQALWEAWKKVRDSGVGYHPDFHKAVKRLDTAEPRRENRHARLAAKL